MLRLRRRFLTRYTAMALFAILAGQLAVAGHAAVADHGVDEQCEVCIGGERLGYGPTASPAEALAPAAQPAAAKRVSLSSPCLPLRHPHARAPPAF